MSREGLIYTIHFERKVSGNAGHYRGWVPSRGSLPSLLARARQGGITRVIKAAVEQDIPFALAGLQPGDRDRLAYLRHKASPKTCEVCSGRISWEDLAAWEQSQIPQPPVIETGDTVVVIARSYHKIQTWCALWGINPHWVVSIYGDREGGRLFGLRGPRTRFFVLENSEVHPRIRALLKVLENDGATVDHRSIDDDYYLSKENKRHAA